MAPQQTGRIAVGSVVAVLAVSSSAILVRWADAPAVVVAFWRCGLGALVLVPAATGVEARPYRARVVVAGVALAVHFWAWLAALEMTSVAAAVTLVTTSPVFVAIGNRRRGRGAPAATWLGIGLAVAGSVVIAGADLNAGGEALIGDGLAVVAAAAMAVYLLAGAEVRQGLGTAAYAARAYGVAALVLAAPAVVASADRALWDWSPKTWGAIVAMVVGPQLLGHTVMAALLPRMGSVAVSLLLLMEPPAAALGAWFLLDEPPPASFWFGAPLVLVGLMVAINAGTADADPLDGRDDRHSKIPNPRLPPI